MIKKAILKTFDSGTYTASVELIGSPVRLTGVPVSRGIPAGELTAGRWVAVLLLDPSNPSDAVVATVH